MRSWRVGILLLFSCGIGKASLLGIDKDSAFVITVLDAPSVLAPGATSNVRVAVERVKGRTEEIGVVRFSLASPPPGVVVTGSLATDERETTLVLVTSTTTPPSDYELAILGNANGRYSTAVLALKISGTAEGGDTGATGNTGGTSSTGSTGSTGASGSGTPAFTYSPNPAVYTRNVAITTNTPNVTDGPVTGWAIAPPLPLGLSFSTTTGAISGTPAVVTPQADYSVTAVGTVNNTTVVVKLTVNDMAPMALSYDTPTAVYPVGQAITANTPNVTGAPITEYSVSPTLPSGLSLNLTTGVITGTPTIETSQQTYVVTGTNSGGSAMANVTITTTNVITGLTYSSNPASYLQNSAITNNTPMVTGGTATSFSAPSLPAGLTIHPTTGVISGTPTTQSNATNYQVTASNAVGFVQVNVSIAVNAACAGQCVPPAPSGWTGPIAVRSGSSPTCTGSFPTQQGSLAHMGLIAAPSDCSSVCTTASGCTVICYLDFFSHPTTDASCGGSAGGVSTLYNNSCMTVTPPWQTYGQDLRIGLYHSPAVPYCLPSNGSPTTTTPTWTTDYVRCDGANPSGACAGSDVCKSATTGPFESTMCLYQTPVGDPALVSCPGSYTSKRIFYQSYSDTRACTQCSCDLNSATCTFDARECTDSSCTTCETGTCPDGQPCASGSQIGCHAGATFTAPQHYKVTAIPGGSCSVTTNSAPTGSAAETNPIVVCCLP